MGDGDEQIAFSQILSEESNTVSVFSTKAYVNTAFAHRDWQADSNRLADKAKANNVLGLVAQFWLAHEREDVDVDIERYAENRSPGTVMLTPPDESALQAMGNRL